MIRKTQETLNRTRLNNRFSGRTTATSVASVGVITILITAFLFATLYQPTGAPLPPPPPLPGPGTFFELGPLFSPPTTPGQATNILCDVSGDVDWGFSVTNNCGLFKFNQVAPIGAGGGITATFEGDTVSAASFIDFTTYSGGGTSNKNNDPISLADCLARTPPLTGSACAPWVWDGGNVPAKDDLSNTYTFAKIAPNGDLILYGGFERISPGGDSHIDLEYFRSNVNITGIPNFQTKSGNCADTYPNGTLVQPVPTEPCHFQGIRTLGDVILSTDFTIGGSFGGITARDWTGSAYSPILVSVNNTQGCNGAGFTGHYPNGTAYSIPAGSLCAFSNEIPIYTGPWGSFDSHGHFVNSTLSLSCSAKTQTWCIPTNGFTEFGVDLTAILGLKSGSIPCISTALAKTRSSQSFTAELKDFSIPRPFNLCKGSVSWQKVDNLGNPLGGATFQLCQTGDSSSGTLTPITPPVCRVIVDNGLGDSNPTTGAFNVTGLTPGNYTLQETIPPPGFIADPTLRVFLLSGGQNLVITPPFTDRRPILKLTGFGYNNTETSTPSQGNTINGTVVYSITIHNYGTATGYLNLTFNVSFNGTGSFSCTGGNTISVTNMPVSGGGDVTFTKTCSYVNAQAGATVDATLNATYNTAIGDTFIRTVNGTPAEIKFTIQPN